MSMQASSAGHKLPTKTLFFYGLADVPVMLALMPMSIYLYRFYTGDIGLAISTVANIMLFARLFDVITDPLIGYLSDHTKSRFGRRKPWMLASVPLLMLGIYKIFMPPEGIGAVYLFSWLMVMWLGWTMLMIPYYAWAAELTTDYDERTKVTGWRSVMGSAGSLLAHGIPAISFGLFAFGGTANYMMLLMVAALVLIPVCIGLTLMKVPEYPEAKAPHVPMMAGLRMMWRNAPFRRLALGYILSYTGLAIVMPLYIFYVEFILEANPASVVWMLLIATSAGLIGVPFWVWLSKHIGKHRAWISGFIFVALASPYFFFLGPGDFWLMAPGIFVIGLGTGAFGTLPNSMKADVIDLDMARSGKNRAAFFFSAWSLVTKLGSALGGWVAMQLIALFGFNALNGAENTPEALFGLRLTYAIVPIFFYLAAVAVIWNYPITKERQERIRIAIDKRQARREAAAQLAE